MELARHAQEIGADGILAITPVFLDAVDRGDPRLFRAAVPFDRVAGSVVQLAQLSRRRRDHRRVDVAADRATAQFRRREGGELQQREVPGDLARGAGAAAGLRDAHRASSSCCPPCRSAASAPIRPRGRSVRTCASQLFDACMRRRLAAGARAAIQDDAALAPVPRPVPVLAQGRHGDHGPPGRADAAAACRPPPRSARPSSAASSKELGILDTEPHGW